MASMGRTVRSGLLVATLAAGTSAAVAQTVTPPTREEINRVPVGPAPRAPSRLTVDGGVERAPCPLADPRYASVMVRIDSVQFDNLRVVSPESLAPAYAEFTGREVPIATVCEIRDRAATLLRRQGYLAAVQVPAQRIENGVVRFDVLMAKLVAVQVRGDAGNSERLIASYLEKLTDQPAFNEQDAARYLLLARDIPGYDVRLTLRPAGTAPGEVVGEVTVQRTPLSVDVNIQNYGSQDVGRFGGLLRGEFYDLLGAGDRLTLGYFATADFEEQHVLQGGYDLRVGADGATLGVRATQAWTKPDTGGLGAGGAGQVRAKTFVGSVEGGYPFLRSEAANVRGAIGLDFIDQRVRLQGFGPASRDKLRIAYLRLDFDSMDRLSIGSVQGYSSIEPRWRAAGSVEFRKGLGIFGASDGCGPGFVRCLPMGTTPAQQLSLSRIEGDPQAALIRFQGVVEVRPMPNIAFSLSPRAQYSRRALASYEEFSGGNYTVGRGYDPGSIIGDSGVGLSAEIRVGSLVPKTITSVAIQPYVFADVARVWNRNAPVALPDGRSDLASAGGGARVTYGDRARLDLTLAKPLKAAGLQARRGDLRFLMSLTAKLVPWTRP